MGEHIDYAGGTVLPFASAPYMYFLIETRDDQLREVCAIDLNESQSFPVEKDSYSWTAYYKRIFELLDTQLGTRGFTISFCSDIPIGGGLSSSSALCIGCLWGLTKLLDLQIEPEEMIQLSSVVEYGLGLEGGLMDQNAIVHSKAGHVMALDCSTNSKRYYKWPAHFKLRLIDTAVSHNLPLSQYTSRRKQLQEALENENASEVARRRHKHVVSEKLRVTEAIRAIAEGNSVALGRLMRASHISLKNDYEVSCEEADFIVDYLHEKNLSYGSRIMGGGFGGHVLFLEKENIDPNWFETLRKTYLENYGLKTKLIDVSPANGILNEVYS